ncbi:unnamed protein product [Absidia cylindrospora]
MTGGVKGQTEINDDFQEREHLLAAIHDLEAMKKRATDIRTRYTAASGQNDINDDQRLAILEEAQKAWEAYTTYKELLHFEYPNERIFFAQRKSTAVSGASPAVLNSIPRLVRSDEKVHGPHGEVHHHVKPFIENLEDYFRSMSMYLNASFPDYMSLILKP